jgi:hypothetical protein
MAGAFGILEKNRKAELASPELRAAAKSNTAIAKKKTRSDGD